MSAVVLLLAAGTGRRFGGDTPKAFLRLGDRTLLERALDVVDEADVEGFVLAVPDGWEEEARALAERSPKAEAVVPGGETRQASARRALAAVPPRFDVVVCHDVARPLATAPLFGRVIAALSDADGAVPALSVPDTVKRVRGPEVLETLHRDELVVAQTPQAFGRGPLDEAHRRADAEGFEATDDASIVERAGFRVVAVPGEPRNLKITVPDDLELARLLATGDG